MKERYSTFKSHVLTHDLFNCNSIVKRWNKVQCTHVSGVKISLNVLKSVEYFMVPDSLNNVFSERLHIHFVKSSVLEIFGEHYNYFIFLVLYNDLKYIYSIHLNVVFI